MKQRRNLKYFILFLLYVLWIRSGLVSLNWEWYYQSSSKYLNAKTELIKSSEPAY